MEKRKWQFKNNYEYYNVLYKDKKYNDVCKTMNVYKNMIKVLERY